MIIDQCGDHCRAMILTTHEHMIMHQNQRYSLINRAGNVDQIIMIREGGREKKSVKSMVFYKTRGAQWANLGHHVVELAN